MYINAHLQPLSRGFGGFVQFQRITNGGVNACGVFNPVTSPAPIMSRHTDDRCNNESNLYDNAACESFQGLPLSQYQSFNSHEASLNGPVYQTQYQTPVTAALSTPIMFQDPWVSRECEYSPMFGTGYHQWNYNFGQSNYIGNPSVQSGMKTFSYPTTNASTVEPMSSMLSAPIPTPFKNDHSFKEEKGMDWNNNNMPYQGNPASAMSLPTSHGFDKSHAHQHELDTDTMWPMYQSNNTTHHQNPPGLLHDGLPGMDAGLQQNCYTWNSLSTDRTNSQDTISPDDLLLTSSFTLPASFSLSSKNSTSATSWSSRSSGTSSSDEAGEETESWQSETMSQAGSQAHEALVSGDEAMPGFQQEEIPASSNRRKQFPTKLTQDSQLYPSSPATISSKPQSPMMAPKPRHVLPSCPTKLESSVPHYDRHTDKIEMERPSKKRPLRPKPASSAMPAHESRPDQIPYQVCADSLRDVSPTPQKTTAVRRIQPQPINPNEVHAWATTPQEAAARHRKLQDKYLVDAKLKGMSYKEIKEQGGFTEAESTLRGRFRSLTKTKSERVRKPVWTDNDNRLLKKAVRRLSTHHSRGIPWQKVAGYIADHGGSYHFGNATCRKRWDSINGKSES